MALAAVLAATVAVWPAAGLAAVVQPRLGSAAVFAVMGGSTITNTGPTVVNGNLALSPGSSLTGFPPGRVTGYIDLNNGAAIKAQTDLVTAYNDAAGETPFVDKSGIDLGGQTLTPGAYKFSSSAQLTGTLTLDGQGATNPMFVFEIGSALTTASNSRVSLINGANSCNLFWQVTSSATLGTGTSFQGTLIALSSITLTTGATIGSGGGVNGGRALARNGAVTMDSNTITPPASCTPTHTSVFAPGLPDTGGVARPDGLPWAPLALAFFISAILVASTVSKRRRRS